MPGIFVIIFSLFIGLNENDTFCQKVHTVPHTRVGLTCCARRLSSYRKWYCYRCYQTCKNDEEKFLTDQGFEQLTLLGRNRNNVTRYIKKHVSAGKICSKFGSNNAILFALNTVKQHLQRLGLPGGRSQGERTFLWR